MLKTTTCFCSQATYDFYEYGVLTYTCFENPVLGYRIKIQRNSQFTRVSN